MRDGAREVILREVEDEHVGEEWERRLGDGPHKDVEGEIEREEMGAEGER